MEKDDKRMCDGCGQAIPSMSTLRNWSQQQPVATADQIQQRTDGRGRRRAPAMGEYTAETSADNSKRSELESERHLCRAWRWAARDWCDSKG